MEIPGELPHPWNVQGQAGATCHVGMGLKNPFPSEAFQDSGIAPKIRDIPSGNPPAGILPHSQIPRSQIPAGKLVLIFPPHPIFPSALSPIPLPEEAFRRQLHMGGIQIPIRFFFNCRVQLEPH